VAGFGAEEAGGALVTGRARPGQIVPVDSEHSALAQCLRGGSPDEVAKLVLTASGGPHYFLSCFISTAESAQITARFASISLCSTGMRSSKANITTPWAKA